MEKFKIVFRSFELKETFQDRITKMCQLPGAFFNYRLKRTDVILDK